MAERQFKEGRVITVNEIAEKTGIHRITLSRILNLKGYNTGTDNISLLCKFFSCRVEELIEYVDE